MAGIKRSPLGHASDAARCRAAIETGEEADGRAQARPQRRPCQDAVPPRRAAARRDPRM